MKISELIMAAQLARMEHGDLEIVVQKADWPWGYEPTSAVAEMLSCLDFSPIPCDQQRLYFHIREYEDTEWTP